jgi:regulator of protease activity HflC (stomatin/prohibitin superfamily)
MTFVFAAFLFLVVVALIVLAMTAFVVQQQTVAIVQRFGKFARLGGPGLNIKIPLIETVADRVNLRVQLLPVIVETKTKDNVFVHITVSVQYAVIGDRVYDAYYKLQKPIDQITAFVFDVIRAHVPSLDLDEVFLRKDEIANAVRDLLTKEMAEFGYGISTALVTEIEPDKRVKDSMNEKSTPISVCSKPQRPKVKRTKCWLSNRPKLKPRARRCKVRASRASELRLLKACSNPRRF